MEVEVAFNKVSAPPICSMLKIRNELATLEKSNSQWECGEGENLGRESPAQKSCMLAQLGEAVPEPSAPRIPVEKTKIRTLQSILYNEYIYTWAHLHILSLEKQETNNFDSLFLPKKPSLIQNSLWQEFLFPSHVWYNISPLTSRMFIRHRDQKRFLLACCEWHNNVTAIEVVWCELALNNTSKRVLFHLPQGGSKYVLASPCLRADLMLIVFIYSQQSGEGRCVSKTFKGRSSCGVDTVPHRLNSYLRIVCVCVGHCARSLKDLSDIHISEYFLILF